MLCTIVCLFHEEAFLMNLQVIKIAKLLKRLCDFEDTIVFRVGRSAFCLLLVCSSNNPIGQTLHAYTRCIKPII